MHKHVVALMLIRSVQMAPTGMAAVKLLAHLAVDPLA